ncbi:MAG: hypothetical protein Q9172_002141 [Xanthocarpia lactea]
MFNPFRQRSIDPDRIHKDDIEKALSQFCAPPGVDRKTRLQPSISDSTFKRIAELLAHLQAHNHTTGWSDRPRTYTVLRNINRLDLFQHFIDLGLKDISFPYTVEKIPDLIHEDDLKDKFLKHQRSVDQVWSRMSFREFARKKFLRKKTSRADQAILRNFENELTNLKRLSHEHLVKVVGSYTDQRSVAFLMEPVADMNLSTFLENFDQDRHRLSPSLRSYFGCLVNAVGYLHTQRIRHRDLKPENILIQDLKVYIADFGTARDWSHAPNDTTTDSGVPTTAPYMAPEVAKLMPRNSYADMWSLGVVYLEMVTVLRGQTVPKMRKFIVNHGTKHPYVYGNGPATTQWFEELRRIGQGPASDNEPLTWIKDLTQTEPQRRPRPWALTNQIRSSVSSTAFIGICCADEDEINDYPSPPSTANSEEMAPLQEQLEALGLFERPHGSLLQPHKQSSLEQWRANVFSDTAPYAMSLQDNSVYEDCYEITEDESVESEDFTIIRPDVEGHGTRDYTIIESCNGYDIAEDDPDEENTPEANGYEITEDSSESDSTVCPPSPQLRAGCLAPLTGEAGVEQDGPPPGSLSPTAIIEQLDLVPELPEPPDRVLSLSTTMASVAEPTPVAESTPVAELTISAPPDAPASDRHPRPTKAPTKANRTVSFTDVPVFENGTEEEKERRRAKSKKNRKKEDRPPPGSVLPTAIIEQLDLVPELPEPPDQVLSVSATIASVAELTTSAPPDAPASDRLPRRPRHNKTPTKANRTVSFTEVPVSENGTEEEKERKRAKNKEKYDGPPLGSPSPTAITEQLNSVPELPKPPDRNKKKNEGRKMQKAGEALTTENLSMLSLDTAASPAPKPARSGRTRQAIDTKPKMTAGFYMQEVWEAANTIQTSVLDAKTQKAFAQLGPGIVWQDRTQHLVESYAKQGKAAAVRELLRAGCNPGTRKKPRWKPLIIAIRAGTQRHNKVVKVLLDHGADVNARHPATGKTSLHFAIENPFFPGYTNIIRILLEHGADPNALDKNKDSPLLQILYGGYKPLEKHKRDALACLLQDHIDVDVNVMPLGTLDMPIHLAVRRRDAVAVAILIHRGSQVNTPNSTGLTPLGIAASSWSETSPEEDIEVLKYLLSGGANINETTGEAQYTVLQMAARQGCVQAVKLLLSITDGPQLPSWYESAAEAATANKSKMSKASYTAILQALESAKKG